MEGNRRAKLRSPASRFANIDHRHILDTQHRAGMNLVPMLLPTGWQLLARVALTIR